MTTVVYCRALKRVVSEPGPMCPPPPPPPPPAEEALSSPSRSPSPPEPEVEVVEEPTVKPSEVVQREEAGACDLLQYHPPPRGVRP